MNKNEKIIFVGLGYIGFPTATIVANNGFKVVGVDINQKIVETINKGGVHILEPGLWKLVQNVVNKGFLRATTIMEEANVFVVVVPTPFKLNHEPDISYVEDATNKIIPFLKTDDLFIIESTSPVHTTEKMADLIFSKRPELKNKINIAYCPERVLPGNVIYELEHNDRVIGGIDEKSTKKACEFYSQFVKGNLHKTNSKTAEMCKLTENSSRDVQIAFANELSLICDEADINVRELINLANKHPRVNILQPGSGVGGHCIAVDPWFIVSQFPKEAKIIRQAREVNDYKAKWCAEKIKNASFEFEKKNKRWPIIACLGLAFKPNIDDLRESPAKQITQEIIKSANNDEILVVEPNIKEHSVFKLTDYKEACKKADIIAILVSHDQFKNIKAKENQIVLDFSGALYKNR